MGMARLSLVGLAFLLGLAAPARAADAVLAAVAQDSGGLLFQQSGATGMVLAIVRGPEQVVTGFGAVRPGARSAPDGRSLVRVGSISKTATGQLLAGLVVDGTVRLSDPLTRHLPSGVAVPSFAGRPIRLIDLATHAAGLERELDGSDVPEPPPDENAYARLFTAERYLAALGRLSLPYAPGTVLRYSNYGFGLLGLALGRAAGARYGDLLERRLAGPLGMVDTTVRPTEAQRERLLVGYDPMPHGFAWDGTEAMEASGGVFSTADDMARWLHFLLGRGPESLAPERQLMLASAVPSALLVQTAGLEALGTLQAMGLGWEHMAAGRDRPFIIQKTGAFSGFVSYVAFAPGRDVGIFVSVSRQLEDLAMLTQLVSGANLILSLLSTR